MIFLHVSDLHIGRRLGGKSLMEDQAAALNEIIALSDEADAVIIAGDIYDKAQPSAEAVELCGEFLTRLAATCKPAFIIAGNHDSPEQVAYCREILSGAGIRVSRPFSQKMERYTLRDAYGEIDVWLLPFIKPSIVRRALPERGEEIKSASDAVRCVIEASEVDFSRRNVLVAHLFASGASVCESDCASLGGADAVSARVFEGFDYAALGHLHSPQSLLDGRARYAGSPLKYSLSEERQKKAALLVEIGEKGEISVKSRPYHPTRELKTVRGELAEITSRAPDYDYAFVILTDEAPPLDPLGSVSITYPNCVGLRLERQGGGASSEVDIARVEEMTPLEHFIEFYTFQNEGRAPDEERISIMRRVISEAEDMLNASD